VHGPPAQLRPRCRPRTGDAAVLGEGLRGDLDRRPDARHGDRSAQPLRGLRRQAGASEPTARGAIERILERAAVEYTLPDQPKGCFITSEPLLGDHRAASDRVLRERLSAGGLPAGDVDALAAYVAAVLAGMSARARDGASCDELREIAAIAMRAWPVSA
jgi:hypothetical protein